MKRLVRKHKNSILFVIAIILNVILMGLFSSEYQDDMFMPFVENFISNLGNGIWNPYDYYYNHEMVQNFPYPPLMLFIISIPGIILHVTELNSVFISNIIFKIQNLIFGLLCMHYLSKIYPDRKRKIYLLGLTSPIILYASYLHGQLDMIPTAFLIGAVYHMTSKEDKYGVLAPLMLAAAISCKMHILAAVPIVFQYIYLRDGIRKCIRFFSIAAVFVLVCIGPFWGEGFVYNVLFNDEQTILTKVFFDFAGKEIYIPILAVLIIYLKVLGLKNMNKDLLFGFLGVLFATFLALIPPMPGWYVWIIPFLIIFFVNFEGSKYTRIIVNSLLNILYLVYFVFMHRTSHVDLRFLGRDLSCLKLFGIGTIKNLIFTLLVGVLAYVIILMYQMGVGSNSLYKRRNLPFTIGITGDSGSGKSTFNAIIAKCLGNRNLLCLEGDDDHKWERNEKEWDFYTHLNPKANYIYRQASDINILRKGEAIQRVAYDHENGKFTDFQMIKPKKYILISGLHSLYLPQMRKNLDLKIYIDTDEVLRRYWKIQRDVKQRGHSLEEIVEQIEKRSHDFEKYIEPQKRFADLVIKYFDENLKEYDKEEHRIQLSLMLTLSVEIDLEPLIQILVELGVKVGFDYSTDVDMQSIVFDGESLESLKIPFSDIAERIIPQLDELTREKICSKNNIENLLQVVVLLLISYKMRE